MPLNSESLSAHSRQEFCLALRAAREGKGITLAEIADTTKIPASLFAALEHNDLRRWPTGLFRRSFFRDYVGMIGVPVAAACAEFVRLFPDDEGAERTEATGAANEAHQANDVRLELDAAWHGRRGSVLSRLLAAGIDAGAVILVAAALAWVAGVDQAATTAIVALAYFSLATTLVGESPAKWAMSRRRSIVQALAQGPAAIVAVWRRGGDAMPHVFGSADDGTPERMDEPELRAWITDARRVGPAPARRLRVRVKVPQ
ncbi:MAG: helix-turn-helix domain-containing protein [Vicinamibacterales bacterium]